MPLLRLIAGPVAASEGDVSLESLSFEAAARHSGVRVGPQPASASAEAGRPSCQSSWVTQMQWPDPATVALRGLRVVTVMDQPGSLYPLVTPRDPQMAAAHASAAACLADEHGCDVAAAAFDLLAGRAFDIWAATLQAANPVRAALLPHPWHPAVPAPCCPSRTP